MPEKVNDKTIFSLLEVTKSIQKTIADRYKTSFWVNAEMNKLNYYKLSGHCYPELVEKRDGKIIAQIKSNLWKDDYIKINNTFQHVLKEPLKDGIKILFLASVSFHPEHGLSLRIIDIDPSYTLGDLEKEKQATIKKLHDEGIFKKNKALKLPLLPQRIAIISVESSRGYLDFLGKINTNNRGYAFFHMLFPAILQGDNVFESMSVQLKRIIKVKKHFDVVAIIRGGGGDVGLSAYNNYKFAKEVALFPIPVLTGIGHITNETVVEMVSHKNLITPTDLADYLVDQFDNFSVPVLHAKEKIIDKSRRIISEEKVKFQSEVKFFRSVTENILTKNQNEIKSLVQSIVQQSRFLYNNEKEYLASFKRGIIKGASTFYHVASQEIKFLALTIKKDVISQLRRNNQEVIQSKNYFFDQSLFLLKNYRTEINNMDKNIINMSPDNVLKRGYSITLLNGKAVKNVNRVNADDTLHTIVSEGSIISQVKSLKKSDEQ